MPPTPTGAASTSPSASNSTGQSSIYVNPSGPPKLPPLVAKRPHRRGPHACDECRLRKRACDSTQPCGPCRRSDTECTYLFRKPAPRPTSRIRTLQNHLRQARGWLQQVKDNKSTELDLDECLRILDFSLPGEASSQPSAARHSESSSQERQNMLVGRDRLIGTDGELTYMYGAYSDASFISRTIELLQIRRPPTQDPLISVISDLFSRPLCGHTRYETPSLGHSGVSCSIPPDSGSLLDAVFERGDLMLCFLPEQQLRDLVASGPEVNSPKNQLSLLHLVLALGYLYNSKGHGELCEEALQKATQHFHAGMATVQLTLIPDITSLAASLCAVVFLFSSYRTASAYTLIANACSTAIRIGLPSNSPLPSGVTPEVRRYRRRLLAAVVTVDRLGSLILDLPAFLNKDLLPHARLEQLALEAEATDDVLLAALLRESMLLDIPMSVRIQANSDEGIGQEKQSTLQKAQDNCQRWKTDTSSVMTKLGQNPSHHGAKTHLEMMFSLCQLFLFRPHLHHIRDMYAGKTVSVSESYYALGCIKVASSTILMIEKLRDQSQSPTGESWLSIYAVFSSVMCLVFLVAANPGTTLPSVAWQRACRGIRVIAANRCADNLSTVCLELLKLVTQSLKETIYIDFDRIEVSTASNCGNKDGAQTTGSHSIARDSQFFAEDIPTTPQQDQASHVELDEAGGRCWDDLAFDVGNEADKMLEQAEALPVDIDFQDLLELSNSE